MMKWALGLFIALMTLKAGVDFAAPWIRYDLHHGTPRAHFYSPEAWADCAAMEDEAHKRGAKYWTCHKPPPATTDQEDR